MSRPLLALLLLAALALGACGGDDEEPEPAATQPEPIASVPEPVTTPPPETPTVPDEGADPDREPRTIPPEEQRGDEEPIRSEAVFTGRGGRLTPRVVRVPPFIAIKVILRAADASRDQGYTLEIGGERLAIGHERAVDEVDLAGLLPDDEYVGRSPQGRVRIVPSAEPGP